MDAPKIAIVNPSVLHQLDERGFLVILIWGLWNLGFAVQFNAETPWHFAQLRYPRVR